MASPIQKADKTDKKAENDKEADALKVKPSSIPLYPEPEKWEYYVEPPSTVENFVKESRLQVTKVKAEYQPVLDKVCQIVSTGRAHTNETLITLRREDNLLGRVGAIAAGGLLGLIAARRGRFIKKLTYLSVGLGGAGSVCYPKEASVLAGDAGNYALKNARIAYHFVVGSRPTVQNEDGKPFQAVKGMVSDMGRWGAKLFESKPVQVDVADKKAEIPAEETDVQTKQESVDDATGISETKAADIPTDVSDKTTATDSAPALTDQTAVVAPDPTESPSSTVPLPEVEPPVLNSNAIEDSVRETETPVPTEEGGSKDAPEENDVSQLRNTSDPEEAVVKNSSKKEPLVIEGDLGQGTLEDKELYTTRE